MIIRIQNETYPSVFTKCISNMYTSPTGVSNLTLAVEAIDFVHTCPKSTWVNLTVICVHITVFTHPPLVTQTRVVIHHVKTYTVVCTRSGGTLVYIYLTLYPSKATGTGTIRGLIG